MTSRRSWIGRALGTLTALELTWVCCGVDYPKLVEGEADYAALPPRQAVGPRTRVAAAQRGGRPLGTFDGEPYRPQADPPAGLVAAADRATYDLVHGLLPDLG